MAVDAEDKEQEEPRSVAELTTGIVVAYVANNTTAMAELGDLI
jgi:predicted transcriptional regulator